MHCQRHRALMAVLTAAGVVSACLEARAEPYFAQREGYKCGRCHTNRTGGGKRTPFGYHYARAHLTLYESRVGHKPAATVRGRSSGPMLDPQLNDHVSVNIKMGILHKFFECKFLQHFIYPTKESMVTLTLCCSFSHEQGHLVHHLMIHF